MFVIKHGSVPGVQLLDLYEVLLGSTRINEWITLALKIEIVYNIYTDKYRKAAICRLGTTVAGNIRNNTSRCITGVMSLLLLLLLLLQMRIVSIGILLITLLGVKICNAAHRHCVETSLKSLNFMKAEKQWCSGSHTIPLGVWATLFAAACRPYDPILSTLAFTQVMQPHITFFFYLSASPL